MTCVFPNKQCSLVSDLVKNVSLLMSIFVSTGCIFTYTFMIVFKVFKLDHKEQIMQLTFFNLFTFCVFVCEQIENDDDVELSNTASVYHGSPDVYNNVPMIQQVDWSYPYLLFLLPLQNHYRCSICMYTIAVIINHKKYFRL